MDKKVISKLLQRQFYPILKAQGFIKKGDVFRQVEGEVVQSSIYNTPLKDIVSKLISVFTLSH